MLMGDCVCDGDGTVWVVGGVGGGGKTFCRTHTPG